MSNLPKLFLVDYIALETAKALVAVKPEVLDMDDDEQSKEVQKFYNLFETARIEAEYIKGLTPEPEEG